MPVAERVVRRWLQLATIVVAGGLLTALWLAHGASGQPDTSNASPKDPKVSAAMARAGCTYRAVAPLPPKGRVNFHKDSPTLLTKVKWSTFPPSGGGHYQDWAVWNFYRRAVNPRKVVHNLEHGGVVIWWGQKVRAATVNQLEAFYNQKPDAMFGTPIAGLGKKIALTAWSGDSNRYYTNGYFGIGHIAVCTRFNQAAFATFREAFRGAGPEGLPIAADKRGTGPGGP